MIHHQVPGPNSEPDLGWFLKSFGRVERGPSAKVSGCFPGETPGWFVALPTGPNGKAREKARFITHQCDQCEAFLDWLLVLRT